MSTLAIIAIVIGCVIASPFIVGAIAIILGTIGTVIAVIAAIVAGIVETITDN